MLKKSIYSELNFYQKSVFILIALKKLGHNLKVELKIYDDNREIS